MTNKVTNYVRAGLAALAIAAVTGCERPNTISYSELTKKYGASPMHSVVATPGRTLDGLTSDTTKGVPKDIRRFVFMIENGNGTTEIEAGKKYLVHDYTNNLTIVENSR